MPDNWDAIVYSGTHRLHAIMALVGIAGAVLAQELSIDGETKSNGYAADGGAAANTTVCLLNFAVQSLWWWAPPQQQRVSALFLV